MNLCKNNLVIIISFVLILFLSFSCAYAISDFNETVELENDIPDSVSIDSNYQDNDFNDDAVVAEDSMATPQIHDTSDEDYYNESNDEDNLGASDSSILTESSIIYVNPVNGDDNNAGSDSNPVKTLNKAWDLVSTGGTIFLNEGIYTDNLILQQYPSPLVVDKSVSFVGVNREKTILTGSVLISCTAENFLNFSNFTVKNAFTLQGFDCVIHSKWVNMTFEKISRGDATFNNCNVNITNCFFNQRTFWSKAYINNVNVNFISCTFTNCQNMVRNELMNEHTCVILFNYCSFINCTDITQIISSSQQAFWNHNITFNNSYFAMNDNPSGITNVNLDNWVVMTFENTTEILHATGDAGFYVSLKKLAHADGTFTDLEHPELLSLPNYDVVYILTNGTTVTRTLENLEDTTTLPLTGYGTIKVTAAGQTLKYTIGISIILNIEKYDAIDFGGEQDLVFISDYKDITGNMIVTITGPDYFKEKIIEIYGGRAFLTLNGLNAGKYTVNVTYSGDENHYPATNSTTFNVYPVASEDIDLKVYANDFLVGDDANILVFVGPKGATGNVTLTIDGNPTTINLDDNGVASFSIKDLSENNYTFTVKYNGDNNFENASTTAKLKVMPNTIVENLTEQLNQTKADLANKTEQLNQTKTDLANKTTEIAKTQEQVTKLTQENTKLTNDLNTANQKAATASNNANAKIKKIKAAKSVKKSKKYTITVTLNKKVKGKFVYVSFNGKVYKAKTNAKGIAKITIKKSAFKKITGKKIKYQVISGNSLKNKTVKIKK